MPWVRSHICQSDAYLTYLQSSAADSISASQNFQADFWIIYLLVILTSITALGLSWPRISYSASCRSINKQHAEKPYTRTNKNVIYSKNEKIGTKILKICATAIWKTEAHIPPNSDNFHLHVTKFPKCRSNKTLQNRFRNTHLLGT